jgi:signal transduction histidine kinase
MTDLNIIINTCYETTKELRVIASYSHIIPIFLSLFLTIFVLIKAKFNLFSKVFSVFILTFSFWLIGDLFLWTNNNYYLIYSFWSPLVFIEIVAYVMGTYFALLFIKKSDINIFYKIILLLITVPPFIITTIGKSVTGFNQPMCEAYNNNFLDIYKLIVESFLLLVLLFFVIKPFILKNLIKKQKTNLIVLGSIILFLSVFGITEYIASMTGFYEINLYSLFLLPLFLVVIIYAIFELDIFNFEILGTQYLVVGLVILMVGQLFFVNGNTDRLLTIITVIISVSLSIILFRNFKKETDQRVFIENISNELEQSKIRLEESNFRLENANEKLKSLDKLKTEFVSLASHQLRSPLTAIKGYTSMLIEGDYGDINPQAKETIDRIMESSNNLTLVVEDLLNVSKIEQGGLKYEMIKFDFSNLVEKTVKDLSITAEKKGLKLIYDTSDDYKYFVTGDEEKLRQVLVNLIDNSMKYTPEGEIKINLSLNNDKIILSVKDSGVGIPKEIIGKLFEKFSRGEGSKLNSSGSGLGLYLVKEIVRAHKGRVWVESEGDGKGSNFLVEIAEAK